MFDLNPLNLPDASLQQAMMLIVAGALGFVIGYVSRQRTLRQLDGDLATTLRHLDDCQRAPAVSVVTGSNSEETAILSRIAARANELNLARIGSASVQEADDLTAVVGIGPFLEKKLHAIGIYTYRQIAQFNREDIDLVSDVIEFFPGRIERENWVGQATELAKK